MDAKGKEVWLADLDLPVGRASLLKINVDIDTPAGHFERILYVQGIERSESDNSWLVPGTDIRLTPEGCWHEKHDIAMTLSLEACDDPSQSIKAVVVDPRVGVTMQQYVTNSVEAYSRLGTWRVKQRQPLPPSLGIGERLDLVQTIGGESRHIDKFFIAQRDKITIVSRYRASDARQSDQSTAWLLVASP